MKQDDTVAAVSSRVERPLSLPDGRTLELAGETPLVMGIVNITPDSFSDGGRFLAAEAAVEHGLQLLEEGADLLDLGAESSRPGGGVYGDGAPEVSQEEELARLLPVIEGLLRAAPKAVLSIDTRKGPVARAALSAGAHLINDVTALSDPDLAAAVADSGCPLVLMHSRGERSTMQKSIAFGDLLSEVRRELADRAAAAQAAGIPRHRLIVDPGIGFGKGAAHNAELLARLPESAPPDLPILVGASRKSFIGQLAGGAPPQRRLPGSLAAVAWAAGHRAAIVRVHDVAETVQFLRVWRAIAAAAGDRSAPAVRETAVAVRKKAVAVTAANAGGAR